MPIYEYECSNCHHSFDVLQKISDDPVGLCPSCSKSTAVRLVSAAGFQLKGTGWYVTDFKNKGKSDQAASSKSEVSSTKSTESTVAASASPSTESNTTKGESN
jgi:putative FmdB family regulatory protein